MKNRNLTIALIVITVIIAMPTGFIWAIWSENISGLKLTATAASIYGFLKLVEWELK